MVTLLLEASSLRSLFGKTYLRRPYESSLYFFKILVETQYPLDINIFIWFLNKIIVSKYNLVA
jgi:hypothetical protein